MVYFVEVFVVFSENLQKRFAINFETQPFSKVKIISQKRPINADGTYMKKEHLILFLPLSGLIVLMLILYFLPVLSDLTFMDKTNLLLTFSISVFAAIEGYSTFKRWSMEEKNQKLADARNELEKAYGPLYTLLNKTDSVNKETNSFWLSFDERKKVDDIVASYPFMFTTQINKLWQDKIRKLGSSIETSSMSLNGSSINLGVYVDLKDMINEEYSRKVKLYHELLEK
jgi:hypothetical protein